MKNQRTRFAFLGLGIALLLSVGCDSGGSATASGGVRPGLDTDYGMRWDLSQTEDVPSDVRTADLNTDGLFDVVVANSVARDVTISFGQPDGSFGAPDSLTPSGVPWRLEFGDFDNDGLQDIAALTLIGNAGATAVGRRT